MSKAGSSVAFETDNDDSDASSDSEGGGAGGGASEPPPPPHEVITHERIKRGNIRTGYRFIAKISRAVSGSEDHFAGVRKMLDRLDFRPRHSAGLELLLLIVLILYTNMRLQ